jgi:hypothetical protein
MSMPEGIGGNIVAHSKSDKSSGGKSSKSSKADGGKTGKVQVGSEAGYEDVDVDVPADVVHHEDEGKVDEVVATGDGYNHITGSCQASCGEDGICTFTALVDLFASEFGFFHFEECPDAGNMPTITMELGKTYRFIQTDISNYFHPLGFAYEVDGALANADEVDEAYLAYQLNDEDIGLDVYEPNFAHPIEEWATDGEYYVDVTLPEDFESTQD